MLPLRLFIFPLIILCAICATVTSAPMIMPLDAFTIPYREDDFLLRRMPSRNADDTSLQHLKQKFAKALTEHEKRKLQAYPGMLGGMQQNNIAIQEQNLLLQRPGKIYMKERNEEVKKRRKDKKQKKKPITKKPKKKE